MPKHFNFHALALAAALVFVPGLSRGQDPHNGKPPDAEEKVDPFPAKLQADLAMGTSSIYLLDFENARRHFRHAIELDPDHPAAYFFELMSYWYELAYDSLLNRNPAMEKTLEAQADLASKKAEAYAKNPKTAAVGYLYWGGSQGAKGWYHFSRGNWVRAYLSGKKGYGYMKKVLELDPELYDAYLGVGMFEYYAATLGPTLKALASFAIRGNKEEAVRRLNLAKTRSRYVKLEAAYFLWNAAMDEGRFEEGLERALEFKKIFPESPFFRWCEIYALYRMGRWNEMLKASERYYETAAAAPQPEHFENTFDKLLAKIYYHSGMAALQMRNIRLAKACFDRTIDQKAEFPGWKVLAHLRRGEIFDLEGKRQEALIRYKAVLKYPDFYDSRKIARKRIKQPYRE